MSTRGAWGFSRGTQRKIAYNHMDSYPDWLGKNVFTFCKETDDKTLDEIFERIQLIDEDSQPTPEQVEECRRFHTIDLLVSEQSEDDWYCLIRRAQGLPDLYRDGLTLMVDADWFLQDSDCEYAYIINLDERTLEIYHCGVMVQSVPLKKIRRMRLQSFINKADEWC
jgi:hypothetical protein